MAMHLGIASSDVRQDEAKHMFSRSLKFALPGVLAAMVLATLALSARAEEPATAPSSATGAITGAVVQKDGQPAANLRVRLFEAPGASQGGAVPQGKAALKGRAKGQSRQRGRPVGEATTDAAGKFTFTDLAPGNYIVIAAQPAERAVARARLSVTADQMTQADLKLQDRGATRRRAGDSNPGTGATTQPSK
jgi:protocatechuate 3,4-dioxygenase beta subunit